MAVSAGLTLEPNLVWRSKGFQTKFDIILYSKPKPTITVDLSRGHGLNIWREERIGGKLFCSDAVMERVTDAGLRVFPKLRAAEV